MFPPELYPAALFPPPMFAGGVPAAPGGGDGPFPAALFPPALFPPSLFPGPFGAVPGASYHVYSNDGAGGVVDYGTILATVAGTAWTTPALAFPGDYTFAVRAADPTTGYEEQNVDARVRIILDAAGVDVTARPAPPTGLGVAPIAGGKLRVRWRRADSATGARPPTGFHVYAGIGTPDYVHPRATVPYTGSPAYVADLSGLTPGLAYAVGVRAFNAAGEEPNATTATATPDATGPAAVAGLTITATSTG